MSTRLRDAVTAQDYERQAIANHIEDVERRIRIMCRVSQVFSNNQGPFVSTVMEDYSDMVAWNDIFYEFMDRQADDLETLRKRLEKDFSWISIEGLRNGEDFRVGKERAE